MEARARAVLRHSPPAPYNTAGPRPAWSVPHRAPLQSLGPVVKGRAPAATHRLTTPVLILICLRRGSAMAAGAVTAQPRAAHAPSRQPGRHHRRGREPRLPPLPRAVERAGQWRGAVRAEPPRAGRDCSRTGRGVGAEARYWCRSGSDRYRDGGGLESDRRRPLPTTDNGVRMINAIS